MKIEFLAPWVLFLGCGPSSANLSTPDNLARTPAADSIEARGVLTFLNEAELSFEVLDDEVNLDARAAASIFRFRAGTDGSVGSADDAYFSNFDELDDLYFVGPSALQKLTSYARDNGWVLADSDVLGVFEGWELTVEQAAWILRLANESTLDELDNTYYLGKKSATSIVDAQPIATISELASVPNVGPFAFEQLLHHATNLFGHRCFSQADCETDEQCQGIPSDNWATYGMCVSTTPIPGEWDECTMEEDCGPGLTCAGLTLDSQGWCVANEMTGTFSSGSTSSIPDNSSIGSSVVAYGLGSVPMDIVVTMDIEHDSPSDLEILLTDPNGDVSVIWDGTGEFGPDFVALDGISRDDEVNGGWKLKVIDSVQNGSNGWIRGWSLHLTSRYD